MLQEKTCLQGLSQAPQKISAGPVSQPFPASFAIPNPKATAMLAFIIASGRAKTASDAISGHQAVV